MRIWQLLAIGTEKINPDTVGVPRVTDANSLLTNVLNTVYFWAGVVCVLAIIIGAYLYATSAADASSTKRAKNTIVYALAGLVVVLMAFVITQFVLGRI